MMCQIGSLKRTVWWMDKSLLTKIDKDRILRTSDDSQVTVSRWEAERGGSMEIARGKKNVMDTSNCSHFCSLRRMHISITLICLKLYNTENFFFKPFSHLLSFFGLSSTLWRKQNELYYLHFAIRKMSFSDFFFVSGKAGT